MATVLVVTREGEKKDISAQNGVSLMESIRRAGIDELLAICGGSCACATCHVFVADPWMAAVGQPGTDEDDLLSGSVHRKENSRLSCQILINDALDGLAVEIAPED